MKPTQGRQSMRRKPQTDLLPASHFPPGGSDAAVHQSAARSADAHSDAHSRIEGRRSRRAVQGEFDRAMIELVAGRMQVYECYRKPLPRALLKPGPSYVPESPHSEAELREARKREAERQLAGLAILAEHYGISKHYGIGTRSDCLYWQAVALELARDFLRYFKPRSKHAPGPAKLWTRKELIRLWREIQLHRNLNSRRLDDACIVVGRRLYPSATNARRSKYNLETLIARYKDACRLVKRRPDIPGIAEFERDIASLPPVKAAPVQE